jgi:hypothetical protein
VKEQEENSDSGGGSLWTFGPQQGQLTIGTEGKGFES